MKKTRIERNYENQLKLIVLRPPRYKKDSVFIITSLISFERRETITVNYSHQLYLSSIFLIRGNTKFLTPPYLPMSHLVIFYLCRPCHPQKVKLFQSGDEKELNIFMFMFLPDD